MIGDSSANTGPADGRAESRRSGRITAAFHVLAINVTVLLLALVGIEFAAATIRQLRQGDDPALVRFNQIPADAYADRSWLLQHFREYSPPARWGPYMAVRARPVSGETVNVDADGLRKTWNRGGSNAPVNVWVFGGSTVWGMGSRDEFTLPSQISKKLDAAFPGRIMVRNFGQNAANSTQGLLALAQEIAHGEIPHLIVAYHGFNEVYTAYQNRKAGLTHNERNREVEFGLASRSGALALQLFERSATFWATKQLASKLGLTPAWQPAPAEEGGRLSADVLRSYEINIVQVDALAARFSFQAWHYWQPDLFAKNPKSPFEQSLVDKESDLAEFYRRLRVAARDRFKDISNPLFRDISDIFDGAAGTIYIDGSHVTERGNEFLAARIASDLEPAIRELVARQPR